MLSPVGIGAIASSGAGFVGAYDSIPNLVHVYEIARRTLTSYTGNLVRLRRSSDNGEMDFGYDANGDLDTAAIATWLGGADGYIVTVYDQVSGDDITQATAASQPLFVASGQGGRPVGRYDGSDDYLQGAFTNGGALSQPVTIYTAAKLDTEIAESAANAYISEDSTQASGRLNAATTAWVIRFGNTLPGSNKNDVWNIWAARANGANSLLHINGTQVASGDAGSLGLSGITTGATRTNSFNWAGFIGPYIIADSLHDSDDRQAMESAINSYYSIF